MKRASAIIAILLGLLGSLPPAPYDWSASAQPDGNSTTPAVGNSTTPSIGNYTAPPMTFEWFGHFIDGILSSASEGAAQFASLAARTAIRMISAIYGPLVLMGLLLWATGIERQLGRRLIIGSVILLVVAESVPLLGL